MPTQTWDNLSDDKRERIMAAALAEFGANGFSSGSLNVVAREAGVAKGSLFQYFDDKLDLFQYVCDHASRRVRAHMLERVAARREEHGDLFDVLRALLVDWVEYYRGHPEDRAVSFAVNFEIQDEARRVVRGVVKRYYLETLELLVAEARAAGQVRDDLDTDHLVSLLLLLLPHLALASNHPELEPLVVIAGLEGDDLARAIGGYVDLFEAAYRPR